MSNLPADLIPTLQSIGGALATGLLVGLQRGWQARERPEGGRVAGLRTFTLIGLLGGLLGWGWPGSPWPIAAGLLATGALFAISWRPAADAAGTLSITSAIAGLVTFVLGAIAGQGYPLHAVGAAVGVALLLDLKGPLHRGLRRMQETELDAVLQLGVLSAVILPLLPNQGFGPYQAINPFQLWLAVIFIAALSLLGHWASRWHGAQHGLLWVGVLGGLASSTAATLSLSRSVRATPELARPAAAAVVAANGMMFVRMAVVVSLLLAGAGVRLGALLAAMGAACFAAAAVLWHRRGQRQPASVEGEAKLFDLGTAFGFALALGIVAVLVRAAQDLLGTGGVFAVAFVSGAVDVDAIVLASVQMLGRGELAAGAAAAAIVLAAVANMIVKLGMASTLGGRALGWRVAAGYGAAAATGAALTTVAASLV
ncbi:DUF4010 domain-containing protein [Ramlibacter tataouinensis]|uniref:MgtC/SapB family protein n=1 Tax=Ramlibacter tataouinensis TaxID=94132 RepID=UPI0022F3B142|nr:DUF4010 domain-containing protein [Ramlibacter tataouinensis]WBY01320.1 DUF4010 domain-containing protein [Ramlibacter tataouinensis]